MIGQKGIELQLGDIVRYKSKSMIHPEAVYEGEVIGVYKYFYEIYGKPLKHTMHEMNEGIYGDPIPYKFCINKYIDIDMERVAVVKETYIDDLTKTA